MIIDTLENMEKYYACNAGIKKGVEFAERVIKENLPKGKYELDGDNLYAMVQEYETEDDYEKFEAHKKYLDMQIILKGEEFIEISKDSECEAITEYNDADDYTLYFCNGLKTAVECKANDVLVFFPEDYHKPCVKLDNCPSKVRKIVVKIKLK